MLPISRIRNDVMDALAIRAPKLMSKNFEIERSQLVNTIAFYKEHYMHQKTDIEAGFETLMKVLNARYYNNKNAKASMRAFADILIPGSADTISKHYRDIIHDIFVR